MDQSLLHADIFFFITTILAIVLGIAFLIALGYLVMILREGRRIMQVVREETEYWRQDIAEFRVNLKEKGPRIATFITLIQSLFKRHNKKSKSK